MNKSLWLLLVLSACSRSPTSPNKHKESDNSQLITQMTTRETDNQTFTLPSDWQIQTLDSPAKITGPRGELVMISSSRIDGNGDPDELTQFRQALWHNGLEALRSTQTDTSLKIVKPLTMQKVDTHTDLAEQRALAIDGQSFYAEFLLADERTVVLATVKGPAKTLSSVDQVQKALQSMELKWCRTT